MSELGAILLAGGRGSRMGGIHKPLLEVGGRTLLDAAISAAREAQCDPIVGVGEAALATSASAKAIAWVREDPPFGGPAAAILAALPLITAPRTFVLACDLVRVEDAVRALQGAPRGPDGVCLEDSSGRRQWLTGIYRTEALRSAAAGLENGGTGSSAAALLGGLSVAALPSSDDGGDLAFDIDTWDDLTQARRRNR
jgi:molybdopterin-guanine dinucleotide biosynthesis protein A